MAEAALASLITPDHFGGASCDWGVANDAGELLELPPGLARRFGRAVTDRAAFEAVAEQLLWERGPGAAAPLIDYLDQVDGDADSEAIGDELEDGETAQSGVTADGTIPGIGNLPFGFATEDDEPQLPSPLPIPL